MAYNKFKSLSTNNDVIQLLLDISNRKISELSEQERNLLNSYTGYGAIKEILYNGDSQLFNKLPERTKQELHRSHRLFAEFAEITGTTYNEVLESVKQSTFTAFFTPPEITHAITKNISRLLPSDSNSNVLEPSAGHGAFLQAMSADFATKKASITAFEKDAISAQIAKNLYSKQGIYVLNMPLEHLSDPTAKYDLVISNIPFGDINVFDKSYSKLTGDRSDIEVSRQSQKRIHNYFFTKAVNHLSDNGIVAFITTSSFMNTPDNKRYREFLFQHCEPLATIRFPDSLFSETAGTQAQSDLVIVRKRPHKIQIAEFPQLEKDLVSTSNNNGYHLNNYFEKNPEAIIHTQLVSGTNQYGRPAQNILFDGSLVDISAKLDNFLQKKLAPYIGNTRNMHIAPIVSQAIEISPIDEQQENEKRLDESKKQFRQSYGQQDRKPKKATQGAQLSLFDLFSQPEELTDPDPKQKEPKVQQPSAVSPPILISRKFATIDELPQADIGNKETILFDGEKFKLYRPHPITNILYNEEISDISEFAKEKYGINKLITSQFISLLDIRNSYFMLYDIEQRTQAENPELRKQLNDHYSRFVSKYGVLNKPSNRNLLNIMPDYKFELVALEIPSMDIETQKVTYHRSEIFSRPVSIAPKQLEVTDPQSALVESINTKGRVDIGAMAAKLGMDIPSLYQELKGTIIFDPIEKDFKIKSIFLGDNLYTLYDNINRTLPTYSKQEIDIYKEYINDTKEAVRSNIPETIPFPFIDVSFGERWVGTEYFAKFLSEHLDTDVKLFYNQINDEFEISLNRYAYIPQEQYTVYGIGGVKSPQSIVKQALLNQNVTVTYTEKNGDSKITLVDSKATKEVNAKVEQLRSAWDKWITQQDKKEIQSVLEKRYNRLFNGTSLQEVDGSLLDLSDLNLKNLGIENIYDSQRNCLMKILLNQGGIADHIPGGGKTLIECMTAHYMKRMGLSNKPIITGLKANILDLVSTYRKAFPHAKILAPNDSDFTAKNRHIFFNQVKNNNWDCIFLSHEQLKSIPISLSMEKKTLDGEIRELKKAQEFLTDDFSNSSETRAAVKGIEKQVMNLRSRLADIQERINLKKDNIISFDRLGIDHIIVDESHMFKNLRFATKHQSIAGIGNPEGSQRAFNLLNSIRTLQDRSGKELQASFFTGTPLSNSISELYLLFKYLIPKELERKGISHFDAWAAVYTRKSAELELDLTNQLKVRERFREYVKLPELIKEYRRIADIRDERDIGLDKPRAIDELVVLPKTPELENLFQNVLKFIEEKDPSYIGADYDDKQLNAASLIGINICEKACMDMRMYDSQMPDHPHNKINSVVKKIIETETAFKDRLRNKFGMDETQVKENQPTHLVFCDKGTPNTSGDFSIYHELKKKLVESGHYAENEVQFIHSFSTQNQKRKLQEHMDKGTVKVLIGSTIKLGIGNNYQSRALGLYNMDIPFKPSEIDQRKGRVSRPGNWLAKKYNDNKVHNFFFMVENSPEVGKLDYVKTKEHFIQQIKKGSLSLRTFTESSMADDGSLSYADMVSQLSGNLDYIKQNKLENKLKTLQYEKTVFMDNQKKQAANIERFTESIPKREAKIALHEKHYAQFSASVKLDKSEKRINETFIKGKTFQTEKDLGEYLIKCSADPNIQGHSPIPIGKLYDFDIYIKPGYFFDDKGKITLNTFSLVKDGQEYRHNSGVMPTEGNETRAARHFYYVLDGITSVIEKETNSLAMDRKNLEQATTLSKQSFLKDGEIVKTKKEIADIKQKIIEEQNKKKRGGDDDPTGDTPQNRPKGPTLK